MAKQYDHTKIEKKWQKKWHELGMYETPNEAPGKKNFYTLVEFPYPSGDLHVGHWYAFAVPDIFARYKRMQGFNVLYPIGFDAFGLPAENAAIKNKVDPGEWTWANIERMRKQLRSMGNMFDWNREVVACDPAYYKWTQWLFLKFFEKGLAYRGKALVNWDPVDQTVLANEQVLPDGTAERSGAKVEKKELEQWFLRITDYADRLVDDLDALDWPQPIKDAQKNWIGRSEGATIDFPLTDSRITRVVILHGKSATPESNFYPWLTRELEARGYAVQVPTLPGTEEPDDETQAAYALAQCSFDEHTAIIGHSFGGIVALRLLERGVNVARVALIATPFSGNFLDGNERPTVVRACTKGFDFEKIRAHADAFSVVYDARDHIVPRSDAQSYADALMGRLIEGRSEETHFMGVQEPDVLMASTPTVRVFTTRPDTLFGATYLVLAPEHPLLETLKANISNWNHVCRYIDISTEKADMERTAEGKEKTGVQLEGIVAVNPATQEEIPVFVADYVLGGYGTGAIMAVPAHDARDFAFAQKFNLPIRQVIETTDGQTLPYMVVSTLVNSGEFNGLQGEEAKKKITEFVGGRVTKTYRQRDWLISRQRYWGAPIPVVYDPEGKPHPIPEEHLPWLLPTDVDYAPKGTSPLGSSKELRERAEKIFGKGWRPEIDTMDTFVDSSWYFLRYLDPKNEKEFSLFEKQKAWMPVSRYSGGAEHTTMHLLYSRFYYKALFDMGLATESEPYKVRMNRGIILAEDGRKMSKRWGNVVNPDEQVANVGADAVKTYLAFIGPYNEVGSFPWNTNGLVGVRRFLERAAGLSEKVADEAVSAELERLLHQSIKKVGDDIESMKFNTSVSQLMILVNEFAKLDAMPKAAYETFLQLLAPFAPHLSEELWEALGHDTSIHLEPWPVYDPAKLVGETVKIAVQVNGKTRGAFEAPRGAAGEDIRKLAEALPAVLKALSGVSVGRTVYVQDRLINLITA